MISFNLGLIDLKLIQQQQNECAQMTNKLNCISNIYNSRNGFFCKVCLISISSSTSAFLHSSLDVGISYSSRFASVGRLIIGVPLSLWMSSFDPALDGTGFPISCLPGSPLIICRHQMPIFTLALSPVSRCLLPLDFV